MMRWHTYVIYVSLITSFKARMVPEAIDKEIHLGGEAKKRSSRFFIFPPFSGNRSRVEWSHSISNANVVIFQCFESWYRPN